MPGKPQVMASAPSARSRGPSAWTLRERSLAMQRTSNKVGTLAAALAKARRYVLCTVSGMPGEEDLQARDLADQTLVQAPKSGPPIKGNGSDELPTKAFQEARKGPNKPTPLLSREASATLRDQLLAELEGLELKDLDAWTFQAGPKANTLTPADGDEVRVAFQTRLGRLQTIAGEDLSAELDQWI